MTEYTPPKPHRPLITRHGIHCTCGVFCGSHLDSWGGHAADRFLLDPTTRLDPRPITVTVKALQEAGQAAIDAINVVFRQFKNQIQPMTRSLARLNLQLAPPEHVHIWRTFRYRDLYTEEMLVKCAVCGVPKGDFTRA